MGDHRRDQLENVLCAVCGNHPATCVNEINFGLLDDYDGVEQLVRSLKGLPSTGNLSISMPTCGICYDQIVNYVVRIKGGGGGFDFRQFHECDESFHDPDSRDGGVLKGSLGEDSWAVYGCPNPDCGKLLPGELQDKTGEDAGKLFFGTMLPNILENFRATSC